MDEVCIDVCRWSARLTPIFGNGLNLECSDPLRKEQDLAHLVSGFFQQDDDVQPRDHERTSKAVL